MPLGPLIKRKETNGFSIDVITWSLSVFCTLFDISIASQFPGNSIFLGGLVSRAMWFKMLFLFHHSNQFEFSALLCLDCAGLDFLTLLLPRVFNFKLVNLTGGLSALF